MPTQDVVFELPSVEAGRQAEGRLHELFTGQQVAGIDDGRHLVKVDDVVAVAFLENFIAKAAGVYK